MEHAKEAYQTLLEWNEVAMTHEADRVPAVHGLTESERETFSRRERDAQELFDVVIQHLFGISLTLRTVSTTSHEGALRLERSRSLIGDTIELIRTAGLEPNLADHSLLRAQQAGLSRFWDPREP